jgi:DnaJ-class molecular chaperone
MYMRNCGYCGGTGEIRLMENCVSRTQKCHACDGHGFSMEEGLTQDDLEEYCDRFDGFQITECP